MRGGFWYNGTERTIRKHAQNVGMLIFLVQRKSISNDKVSGKAQEMSSVPYQRRHAMSRYTAVSEAVIEKCQRDFWAGNDLGQSIPGLSATEVAVIVAESLDADRLLNTSLDELRERLAEPMNDWSLAVLAEMFFAVASQARTMKEIPEERWREAQALAWTALERVLESPTASPLLWYEEIYHDVAQEYRLQGDPHAIELLKRGLAHDLRYHEGMNAASFLRELAETYVWLGELDQGLVIFTALLRNDPADIWTYNVIALTFDRSGPVELGIEVIRRGLALLEVTGDPEKLHDQLVETLEEMRQSEKRGREAEVDPTVLADFRAALALDFDAGQHKPISELCRELVPDLDHVPIKEPQRAPDLPPRTALRQGLRSRRAGRKRGRNDPCWCGSGKKYKHCHMWSDRGR